DDKFSEVQAPDLIVLAERDRADELRSLSRLVTCLNLIQDREEIITNTMVSVKRASAIGLALEGEGSAGFFGPETTTNDGITTDRVFGGGAIWNVPNGRKIREIKDDRPSPNLTEFMDQFLRAVASGLGLPYEYLWKADLSGPSQRFVLAQAQRRFDEISQAIIHHPTGLPRPPLGLGQGDQARRSDSAPRHGSVVGCCFSYAQKVHHRRRAR
ncbi:MAG: phage portal protein, partial [Caulobacteraceae bacterium]|nr:phage portal protein [Caulobacteraceae bacterium]